MSERRASSVPSETALAPRERDYLRRKALGQSQKAIAGEWGVALTTVKTHAEHAHRKLGVQTAIEAFAVLGWLRVPS